MTALMATRGIPKREYPTTGTDGRADDWLGDQKRILGCPKLSRAQRRATASTANRFQKQIGDGALDTCILEAGSSLDGHDHAIIFRRAIADVFHDPSGMMCFVCGTVITAARPFGAFLLSCARARPGIASVSTVCSVCWGEHDLKKIEVEAERVLRRIVPGGKFLDELPEQPEIKRPTGSRPGGP